MPLLQPAVQGTYQLASSNFKEVFRPGRYPATIPPNIHCASTRSSEEFIINLAAVCSITQPLCQIRVYPVSVHTDLRVHVTDGDVGRNAA